MKNANGIRRRRIIIGLAAAVLLVALMPGNASAADARDTIADIVRASSLPETEQIQVRTRAREAVSAGLPAEDVGIIVSRALKRGADAGTITGLLDAGIAAKQQGLPTAPVLDRIEQGLSKGVPPERIDAATRQLTSKLAVAQPLVDDLIKAGVKSTQPHEREAAITASARALEKAIPPDGIAAIGKAVRERNASLPLFISATNTAAYCAGSGMTPETATRLVHEAVRNGYTERDLDRMVKQLADRMMRGTRAEDAGRQMERDTMQGGMEQGMGNRGAGAGPGMGGMGGRRK